ncbi:MAG: SURF1 family protein [Acidimicrobiales bacterium]
MYRFALRPRWILSHLLALSIVGACAMAGVWQYDRHLQRQELNERQEAAADLPPVAMTDLVSPGSSEGEIDEVVLRRVELVGTYQVEDQVTVSNRTFDGAPGYWVLTPLVTADGTGVLVNRGWVPLSVGEGERIVEAAPPEGEVVVTGSVTASQERGSFGAVDPSEGRLERLARADVGRVAAQVEYPVLPAYVTLAGQAPAQPEPLPVVVSPVEIGDGPHLGYTVQWAIFGTIAAVGYPLVLRKVARERAVGADGDRPRPPKRRSSQVPVDD